VARQVHSSNQIILLLFPPIYLKELYRKDTVAISYVSWGLWGLVFLIKYVDFVFNCLKLTSSGFQCEA